ncbi:MAG TPA: GSCFA domain-containing protein [Rhizomicrobium sp.]
MSHSEAARAEDSGPGLATPNRKRPKFHRGDVVNYNPKIDDYRSPTFLQDYLLRGWLPEAPFVTRETKVTAFGSCFAANITRHLAAIGYDLSSSRDPDIYISRIGDGMVNTPAIQGQFEWALENKKPPENLWHGFDAEKFGLDESIRLRTREIFLTTDLFIITLGLSEIWYDEETGSTFWRAVPEEFFDPARHKFRVLSMEETKAGIAEMYRLIRTHVPKAKVLFTVSPIPLSATFRSVSCLTANAVSKAVIRAALDEFLRSKPDLNRKLFYFPSMELVQFGFINPWNDDVRHPKSYVLDTVMKTFEAAYCVGEATLDQANALYQMFRAQNVEEIAQLLRADESHAEKISAARDAERAGRKARREAKQRERKIPHIRKRGMNERRRTQEAPQ